MTICDFGRWGVVIVGGCGCGCGCVNGLAWIEKKVVRRICRPRLSFGEKLNTEFAVIREGFCFFRERERHR